VSWLITRTHDRTAKCPCCRQLFAELDMVKMTPPTASCTSIQDVSSTTSAFFGGSTSASIRGGGGGSFFQPSPRILTILPPRRHPDGAAATTTSVGPSVETATQQPELQEQAPERLTSNVASPPLTPSLHVAAGEDELLQLDPEISIATISPTELSDDQLLQQQCCQVSLAANDEEEEDEKQDHGVVLTRPHPS
jgi:hypothetical protein